VDISPRNSGKVYSLRIREPRADFASYWSKLPLTGIRWMVTALDGGRHPLEKSCLFQFCKADGRFAPGRKHADWIASAEQNVRFILTAKGPRLPLRRGEEIPRWSVDRNHSHPITREKLYSSRGKSLVLNK